MEGAIIFETKVIGAGVGPVEQSQANESSGHFNERVVGAIHQNGISVVGTFV